MKFIVHFTVQKEQHCNYTVLLIMDYYAGPPISKYL